MTQDLETNGWSEPAHPPCPVTHFCLCSGGLAQRCLRRRNQGLRRVRFSLTVTHEEEKLCFDRPQSIKGAEQFSLYGSSQAGLTHSLSPVLPHPFEVKLWWPAGTEVAHREPKHNVELRKLLLSFWCDFHEIIHESFLFS